MPPALPPPPPPPSPPGCAGVSDTELCSARLRCTPHSLWFQGDNRDNCHIGHLASRSASCGLESVGQFLRRVVDLGPRALFQPAFPSARARVCAAWSLLGSSALSRPPRITPGYPQVSRASSGRVGCVPVLLPCARARRTMGESASRRQRKWERARGGPILPGFLVLAAACLGMFAGSNMGVNLFGCMESRVSIFATGAWQWRLEWWLAADLFEKRFNIRKGGHRSILFHTRAWPSAAG